MLMLEALQANDGDCFLLHSGTASKRTLVLIDGGSSGIYGPVIEQRLNELRGNSQRLDLRLVILSHIDADHITGILDMFKDMSESIDDGKEPLWKVASLWHNAFDRLVGKHAASAQTATVAAAAAGEVDLKQLQSLGLQDEKAVAVVASVKQGKQLQGFAAKTKTPRNKETKGKLIVAPAAGALRIKIADGLVFTILGPQQAEIDALDKAWKKSNSKKKGASEQAVAADYLNRTVPNLSSIVFLAEEKVGSKTTRILMTGDAGGDLILQGLKSAKLLGSDGRLEVDILKLQHHGSNHSVTKEFFRKVIADVYVISGNGKHGIPHMDTLQWLSQARTGEPIDVYMTNRHLEDKGKDLTPGLDKFLRQEQASEPAHRYHFRADKDVSISIGSKP